MSYNAKSILLFFIVCLLSFLLAYYIGELYVFLYNYLTGHALSGCGILSFCSNSFDGFMSGFSFFAGLLFLGFLDQKRIKPALFLILIMPAIDLFSDSLAGFIIDLGFGLLGLGLGEIIYLIRQNVRNKKTLNKNQ